MARVRRTAKQARTEILDAAEAVLHEVGPDAFKLAEVARQLEVSHQAILHHFGSRDLLVAAVVRRALDRLSAELISSVAEIDLADPGQLADQLLELAFRVLVDGGYGRLLAWLALTHSHEDLHEERRPIRLLADAVHAARGQMTGREHDPDDSLMLMMMLSNIIMGASVFERGLFHAADVDRDPDARARYRAWLRELVVAHLLDA